MSALFVPNIAETLAEYASAQLQDETVGWNALFPAVASARGVPNIVLNFDDDGGQVFWGKFTLEDLQASTTVASSPAPGDPVAVVLIASIDNGVDSTPELQQYSGLFCGQITLNINAYIIAEESGYPGSVFHATANAVTDTLLTIFSPDAFTPGGQLIPMRQKRFVHGMIQQKSENWQQLLIHQFPFEVFV